MFYVCILYFYLYIQYNMLTTKNHHTVDTLYLPPTILSIYVFGLVCSLFCSFGFVCYIPHRGKITWYLSFSIWLISLNLIPSSFIHVVTNGKISSFYGWIIFHYRYIPHLLYPFIDVEKREPLYTVGGNVNWYSHYGKQCGDSSKKLRTELPYDPAIPLWVFIQRLQKLIGKDICTPCSLQHYLQLPRYGNNRSTILFWLL